MRSASASDQNGETTAAPDAPAPDSADASRPTEPATGNAAPATAPAAPTSSAAAMRDRRPEGPRRVRSGIKLRTRDERPTGALPERWMGVLEAAVVQEEALEGLRYARLGQTVSFEVEAGAIVARVQGTSGRPYETRIVIAPFDVAQWEAIITAMAKEAVYLVKLLERELPEGLDGLLDEMGLSLLPRAAAEVTMKCSCARGDGCRHVAAIGYLFAERLIADPLLLMRWRGMDSERLLERLRQARVLMARGVASAHVDPMIPESQIEPKPLDACIDEFWRPGRELHALHEAPPDHHVPHALLRRLGPSPLEGRFPLVGLLASVYDRVAECVVDLRDRAERLAANGKSE